MNSWFFSFFFPFFSLRDSGGPSEEKNQSVLLRIEQTFHDCNHQLYLYHTLTQNVNNNLFDHCTTCNWKLLHTVVVHIFTVVHIPKGRDIIFHSPAAQLHSGTGTEATAPSKSVRGLLSVGTGYTVHDFFCDALKLTLCGPFTKHLPPSPPGSLRARNDEFAALDGQIENSGGQHVWWMVQAQSGVETVLQQRPW